MTQTTIQLDSPLSLPCGETLPNRLGKSAMTEGCADPLGRATEYHERIYRLWGESGTGLLLTGNIQVDRRSLERPGNIRIEGEQDAEQMKRLARMADESLADQKTRSSRNGGQWIFDLPVSLADQKTRSSRSGADADDARGGPQCKNFVDCPGTGDSGRFVDFPK